MIKKWMSMVVLLAVFMVPGIARAEELPPGDNGMIPVPSIQETADPTDTNPPYTMPEPGIPVPAEDESPGSLLPDQELPPVVPDEPEPEPEPLPVITEKLLAEFATPLINSPANRNHNIKQALQAINEQIVKPGGTWSFNQAVGPRTAARGYKEAIIIVNKKFVPGLGGGICQVSSTLYNAVLQAKLKVLERHPHSLPVKYVAPGYDATISYGRQDFKFMNDSDQDVIIRSRMEAGKVTVAFFARQNQETENPADGL